MARPNKGLGHVTSQPGDPETKRRACGILSTVCGLRPVDEVCHELGIGRTHFDELRRRMLQGALAAIAPRPVGRPPRRSAVSEAEVAAMHARIAALERENQILRAQVDLASVTTLEAHRSKSARVRRSPWAARPRAAAPAGRAVP